METQEQKAWLHSGVKEFVNQQMFQYAVAGSLVLTLIAVYFLHSRVNIFWLAVITVVLLFVTGVMLMFIGTVLYSRYRSVIEGSPRWRKRFLVYHLRHCQKFRERYLVFLSNTEMIKGKYVKKDRIYLKKRLTFYESETQRSLELLELL